MALLALTGCEDPLKDAQVLEEERVLAVRAATDDDSSSLVPGESAQFEVLLADDAGPVDAPLAYQLCRAAKSVRGVPYCRGEELASGTQASSFEPIVLELDASLKSDAQLVLLAVACPRGTPDLGGSPLDWRCSGDRRPLRFSFDAWTRGSASPNQNPDLSQLSVSIGGTEVALDTTTSIPSCDDGARIAADETHEVKLSLGAGARDGAAEAASAEALQLSHFSTGGLFERQFSFIAETARAEVAIEWEAPSSESTAIKQYLVVRDSRGGVGWASWSFCTR